MAKLWQHLLAVPFSHGMAIQVDHVKAVAKGSSFSVLFHRLDPSRRNAFQSAAEACMMQFMKPVGVISKQQYSLSALLGWRVCTAWILVLLGSHFLIVGKQRLQAVKGIGAATVVIFTKACLPPVSVSSNFHPPETDSVAQCRLGVVLDCEALDFGRCGMQSVGDTTSA